jgi:hypothetical protein
MKGQSDQFVLGLKFVAGYPTVLPGIEPGYILFPSQNNNDILCSSSVLQIHVETVNFLAVRRVGLMTHHECRVDRPFPAT